ncbi:MAG: hypothetical protein EXQ50_08045 [Acidobacteria bacterium]|nr:hypothetical protein [Acidobacteriota bacterium]MSO62025.1 hypothetical protein [Acidobacteriota bacterium]
MSTTIDLSLAAQQISEPFRKAGASITPAYEGWFTNADGTHSMLIGYLNRNTSQTIEVAVGPNNRFEPGGPDLGQPAVFLPGRQTGAFIITVPKDFDAKQRLTWSITANGQTSSIPFWLNELYEVNPWADVAVGNNPPVIRFDPKGPAIQGPLAMVAKAIPRSATMAAGLSLPVWATDDAKYSSGSNAPQRNPPPAVILHWSKYRGPGTVTFDKTPPVFEKTEGAAAFNGKATVVAKFSQPGEYILHVDAEDHSGRGGGGEICCFTTAMVKVIVAQ